MLGSETSLELYIQVIVGNVRIKLEGCCFLQYFGDQGQGKNRMEGMIYNLLISSARAAEISVGDGRLKVENGLVEERRSEKKRSLARDIGGSPQFFEGVWGLGDFIINNNGGHCIFTDCFPRVGVVVGV